MMTLKDLMWVLTAEQFIRVFDDELTLFAGRAIDCNIDDSAIVVYVVASNDCLAIRL